MSKSRRVYIVDDDDAVRASAEMLLESVGFEVVTYCSGVEFLEVVEKERPGCVLLDIHMPHLSGLEVQRDMKDRGLNFPVIVLTGQGDVSVAVEAMKRGAIEFIEKPYAPDALLEVIDAAFVSLEQTAAELARMDEARSLVDRLTGREMEVLRGLLGGLPNKLIAYELGISIRTVEIYRANVMEKLQARSLSNAVRIALAAGIEPLSEGRERNSSR